MATPRRKPRRASPGKGGARRGGGGLRVAIALALLVAGIVVVVLLATRARRGVEAPPPDVAEVVRQVAGRHGCPADRVSAEERRDAGGTLHTVTVHAPSGFASDRFSLDLQAAAHNLGGRLDPKPLLESGGYGLARLEGEVGGERWRVVVLGEAARPTPAPAATPRAVAASRLAIVLDDAGGSLEAVREIAKLPPAVAVAVLPNAAHSREVAAALGGLGREVLLHMPMEPLANHGAGPGEGAIDVGQGPAEIEARLRKGLEVVAGARGVNNHMGSRATADVSTMRPVMQVLRARGLYFLDSRTTAETVAESEAHRDGVPALHRDVFLDVVAEEDAVRQALDQAIGRARATGSAVAIGHVHALTLDLLLRELPHLPSDVTLVRPSQLLSPPS
ncbi:MAG TPA: divergent polysaccharide deacetylase family protein [Thermoanaerobaculaceae bacterium]|nr:divergent polysaccharide deacetylase family protein [Thermoanaerobaculaceae bacterium]